MRKVITLALTAVMLLSLCCAAYAVSYGPNNPASFEVTATYEGNGTTEPVYKVTIFWNEPDLTYISGKKGAWDPDAHIYSGGAEGSWDGTGTITVTNHSNTDITATAVFTPADGFDTVDMMFSSNPLTVGSADNGLEADGSGKAVQDKITVTPTGELPADTTNETIGTITITLD